MRKLDTRPSDWMPSEDDCRRAAAVAWRRRVSNLDEVSEVRQSCVTHEVLSEITSRPLDTCKKTIHAMVERGLMGNDGTFNDTWWVKDLDGYPRSLIL